MRTFVLFADLHGIPRGKLVSGAHGDAVGACRGVLTKDLFGRPVLFDAYARPAGGADVRTGGEGGVSFVRDVSRLSGGAAAGEVAAGAGPLGADRISIAALVDDAGGAHPLDARERLRRFADASGAAGSFRVGAELEFHLHPSGAAGAPVDGQAYATGGIAAREAYLSAVLDALDAFGIDWLALSQENEPDQYEIALAHTDPLGQADRILVARLICRALAPRYALACTFAPLVSMERSPSHLHVHLSCDALPVGDVGAPGPLVEGVLAHLDELVAVLCPSALSRRSVDIASFASTRLDVGEDDRFRAVRLLGRGASRRAEVRTATAEANPYLAVLGLVGAAASGTRAAAPRTGAPSGPGPIGYGLGESLDRLAGSALARQLYGAELVAHLIALKRAEYERFDGGDVGAEVALLGPIL